MMGEGAKTVVLTYVTKWSKVEEGWVEQKLQLLKAGLSNESNILQDSEL